MIPNKDITGRRWLMFLIPIVFFMTMFFMAVVKEGYGQN